MHTRKPRLPLFLFAAGIALLVAAVAVGCGSSSGTKGASPTTSGSASGGGGGTSAVAKKGGTLNLNESNEDFDYVDPGLAYRTDDWAMLYTTAEQLVSFPEKSGSAGSQLYPEAATAFPIVSKDGKTYTFHIRPGLRFSDGSPVTAAAFQRAWERNLSPKMGSPLGVNIGAQNMVVGGAAFLAGKTKHISGITAKGLTLTFHLTKPNPTFVSILGMQWYDAVKPSMPYTTHGLNTFASAGPYYIASRDPGRSTVLKRNPYYHGNRPANPDQIVFTPNVNIDQSLLQVKSGSSDMDITGLPPTATAGLAKQYGVNKSRFHVGPTSCVDYMALNTARAPFDNVSLRKAVAYAIDRPAQVRLLGAYAGTQTEQLLVPGIPGYKKFSAYTPGGADVQKAKQVGGSAIASSPTINVVHTTSTYSTNRAQLAEANLKAAGFKVNDQPVPATTFYNVVETKGTSYNLTTNGGWCADYFDPYDYMNVLFDGRTIQATNNVNYTFFNDPTFNAQLDHAASLSGQARANAYANLDHELVTKYAPVVPYLIVSDSFLTSSRVKNWIYSSYFGEPYFNALSVG